MGKDINTLTKVWSISFGHNSVVGKQTAVLTTINCFRNRTGRYLNFWRRTEFLYCLKRLSKGATLLCQVLYVSNQFIHSPTSPNETMEYPKFISGHTYSTYINKNYITTEFSRETNFWAIILKTGFCSVLICPPLCKSLQITILVTHHMFLYPLWFQFSQLIVLQAPSAAMSCMSFFFSVSLSFPSYYFLRIFKAYVVSPFTIWYFYTHHISSSSEFAIVQFCLSQHKLLYPKAKAYAPDWHRHRKYSNFPDCAPEHLCKLCYN